MNPLDKDSYRFDQFVDDLCEFSIAWSDDIQRHIAARAKELYEQPVARQLVRSWAREHDSVDGASRQWCLGLVRCGEQGEETVAASISRENLKVYQHVLIDLLVSPALEAKVDMFVRKGDERDARDES